MKNNKTYKAIDFFCGGGGMTYGLRQAGIDVARIYIMDLLIEQ